MKYRVTLNNRVYEVEVEDGCAVLLDEYEAALPTVNAAKTSESAAAAPKAAVSGDAADALKAPMPGTVLKIAVAEGDKVKPGDTILVIEAMKMENEVAAEVGGTVTKILVAKGQTVQTGDPLVVVS